MGRWHKLGRIFEPRALHPKLASHAANPLAVPLGGNLYRIYFNGRDAQNRSSIGYADVDIARRKVTYVHHRPVFEHGPEGSFFSHGVSIGNCYEAGGRRYMLFMGWQVPAGGRWRGEIGRLLLAEDGSLALDPEEPFFGASAEDPVSVSYPWVIEDGERGFRMWYGSTVAWDAGNGEMLHVINQAVSRDGHAWQRRGLAVPFVLGAAQAFSRPAVMGNSDEGYRMWFSYRGRPGKPYRIGYAESLDGEAWSLRLEEVGIDVSQEGWDCEMICYPFVFDHAGDRYMLYNGNGYGRSGFGLAILDA